MQSIIKTKQTATIDKICVKGRIYEIADKYARDDIEDIKSEINKINEKLDEYPLQFSDHFSFPNIGEADKLYIATDENRIYRYDTTEHCYRCIVCNVYDEIETLQAVLDPKEIK
jgi:hypothetical protein